MTRWMKQRLGCLFMLICLLPFYQTALAEQPGYVAKPCVHNKQYECGLLKVPLSYKNTQLGSIYLSTIVIPAKGKKLGSIYFNSGGPWGNFTHHLQKFYNQRVPNILKEHFDFITFNPRSISPNNVSCQTSNKKQLYKNRRTRWLTYAGDAKGAETIFDITSFKRNACKYNSIVNHMSTNLTLQDLNRFQKALQIKKLDMYTDSYGTRLALVYLQHYPNSVGSLILDGNVAPNNDFTYYYQSRAKGYETILKYFFNSCLEAKQSCALYNIHATSSSLIKQFQQLLKVAHQKGIETGEKYNHRRLNAGMLTQVINANFENSFHWKKLARGLKQAITRHKADILMNMFSSNGIFNPKTGLFPHNTKMSLVDSNAPIYCVDYNYASVASRQNWLASMAKLRKKYPLIGAAIATGYAAHCIDWPAESIPLVSIVPIPLKTDAKVLLLANQHDPVTPLQNSEKLYQYLKKSLVKTRLVVWNGIGHTAILNNAPKHGCLFNDMVNFYMHDAFPKDRQCLDARSPFN